MGFDNHSRDFCGNFESEYPLLNEELEVLKQKHNQKIQCLNNAEIVFKCNSSDSQKNHLEESL